MTYQLNPQLIEDLQKGSISLINDGNYDLISYILKTAFPKDSTYINPESFVRNYKYFRLHDVSQNMWGLSNTSSLRNVSPTQFLNSLDFFAFQMDKRNNKNPEDKNMIPDFSIKGTKLPTIPGGTNYRVTGWAKTSLDHQVSEPFVDLVSFGEACFKDVKYILAEKYNYAGEFLFMFKETDIIDLYKKQNNITKIEGYKLIKPEYVDAVRIITSFKDWDTFANKNFDEFGWHVPKIEDGSMSDKLQKSGVLDIWFEPVFEKQEKIISMGEFNLTVKPGGIFHKTQNITNFVKAVVDKYGNLTYTSNNPKEKLEGYDFCIEDMIISKSGCEQKTTKLSQWLDLWHEYQKIKDYNEKNI